jgi:hypothetical protein
VARTSAGWGDRSLLTSTARLHQAAEAYLCANEDPIHTGYVNGGTAAVSDATAAALGRRLTGHGCSP